MYKFQISRGFADGLRGGGENKSTQTHTQGGGVRKGVTHLT